MTDTTIAYAKIHPAIGIARVGNSASDFFIGPEVPYVSNAQDGNYRDSTGAIKRQAARFRIYGYNAAGAVVSELTADTPNAQITWTVQVANKKAAWYQFMMALDIPEAGAMAMGRRNPTVVDPTNRYNLLAITPGARSVTGPNQFAVPFNEGWIYNSATTVNLGEIRTDEQGRLLFLGGWGISGCVPNNAPLNSIANNDYWYDDICDGPVTATVTIGGKSIDVRPAWVVSAPPNYAPDIISVQTMYDVMYDAFVHAGQITAPTRPSFTTHIYPILTQLSDTQWLNEGLTAVFGWKKQYDLLQPTTLAQLSSNAPQNAAARQAIFANFRDPDASYVAIDKWPQVYGDAFDRSNDPAEFMSLTHTQYNYLRQWSTGNFDADWNSAAPPPPQSLDAVPLTDQPATLDKAALWFCMGGPFHPGTELTWPMRQVSLYSEPFRLTVRPANMPEPDYGDALTQAEVLGSGGPLQMSGPGDLTHWMAVPWQNDSARCQFSYPPNQSGPYLPTFWPARVPNHILAYENYAQVVDTTLTPAQRLAAFNTRVEWDRILGGGNENVLSRKMVDLYGSMGIIEQRVGPHDNRSDFPPVMFVETMAGTMPPFADSLFQVEWNRLDRPVAQGMANYSWVYGPVPHQAKTEAYAEAPGGTRLVQYFDKARLELTARPANPTAVTAGLLTVELVSGNRQDGDSLFVPVSPAQVPVAGDGDDANGPTYASFANVATIPGTAHTVPANTQPITTSISRDGVVSAFPGTLPAHAVNKMYIHETGHNMPDLFVDWLYAHFGNGWVGVTGYPITEGYWATVKVGGVQKVVLMQLYERRVLTYTASNSKQYQVEFGNIGLHYFTWRYITSGAIVQASGDHSRKSG